MNEATRRRSQFNGHAMLGAPCAAPQYPTSIRGRIRPGTKAVTEPGAAGGSPDRAWPRQQARPQGVEADRYPLMLGRATPRNGPAAGRSTWSHLRHGLRVYLEKGPSSRLTGEVWAMAPANASAG